MSVLHSLRQSVRALANNPVLFVPVGGYLLLQMPQFFAGSLDPQLQRSLSGLWSLLTLVVSPFYIGGLFSMVDDAIDGSTRLETFVTGGKANYVQLLVGILLLAAVNIVLGIGIAILAAVGVIVGFSTGGFSGGGVGILLAIGLVGLLFVGLYLGVNVLLGFFQQAVVIDGAKAIEGFERSATLVRTNIGATVGFVIVRGVIGLLGVVPLVVLSISQMPLPAEFDVVPQLSTVSFVTLTVVALLLSTVTSGLVSTYSVSFYRSIRD